MASTAVIKKLKPGDILLSYPKSHPTTSRVIKWLLGAPVSHTAYISGKRKVIHVDSKGVHRDKASKYLKENYVAAVEMPFNATERAAVEKHLKLLEKKKIRYGGENYPALGASYLTGGAVKLPTTKAPVCSTVLAGVPELNKKYNFKRTTPMDLARKGKLVHIDKELGGLDIEAARNRALSAVGLGTAATVGTVTAVLDAKDKREKKRKLEAKLGITKEGGVKLIKLTPSGKTNYGSFSRTVKNNLKPGDMILVGLRPSQNKNIWGWSRAERVFGGTQVTHSEVYTGKSRFGKPLVVEKYKDTYRKAVEPKSSLKECETMLIKMPYTDKQRKSLMKELNTMVKDNKGKHMPFGYENTPQLIFHHATGIRLPVSKNRVCSTFLADSETAKKVLGKKNLTHATPMDYAGMGEVVAKTKSLKIDTNAKSRLLSAAVLGGTAAAAAAGTAGVKKVVETMKTENEKDKNEGK